MNSVLIDFAKRLTDLETLVRNKRADPTGPIIPGREPSCQERADSMNAAQVAGKLRYALRNCRQYIERNSPTKEEYVAIIAEIKEALKI